MIYKSNATRMIASLIKRTIAISFIGSMLVVLVIVLLPRLGLGSIDIEREALPSLL